MRILQLMNRVPWPLKDGGALATFLNTKGFYEAGCEVTVCALNTNKHHVQMEVPPHQLQQIASWYTTDINTNVNPLDAFLNLFSIQSYNVERFASKEFELMLEEVLTNHEPFDVVVFEGLFMAQYLHLVKKKSSAVCVLRAHNVEHRIWETLAENAGNPIKKAYLSMLARRMKKFEVQSMNAFDALTVFTSDDAALFQSLGLNKPLLVAPVGADLKRLVANHQQVEPLSVFHLGSMEWLPNQHAMEWFITHVWPDVLKAHPSATLYIAGRAMPPRFQQYASPSIKIVGEVEDAVQFMHEKHIMIVPLFSGSGMRVKILEGMALGKTIVTTSLGAAGIAVENGKHLIFANHQTEFSKAIIHLLDHPEDAKRIGDQACELAHNLYDNTKVIQHVLSFYQTLISK